jgi:chromosome segregation ATPase
MNNQDDFQKLVMEQFGKIDEQFKGIKAKLEEHDQRFKGIENKLEEHDERFNKLDANLDVVANHARKLLDTEYELDNVKIRKKQLELVKTDIDKTK